MVFHIVCDQVPYRLSKEDACLFNQPYITRLRLSYVDLTPLEETFVDQLLHKSLEELIVEVRIIL